MLPALASIACYHTLAAPVSDNNGLFLLFLHHIYVIYQFLLLLRLYFWVESFGLFFGQKCRFSRLGGIGDNPFRINANPKYIILNLTNHRLPFFDVFLQLTDMPQVVSPLMISVFFQLPPLGCKGVDLRYQLKKLPLINNWFNFLFYDFSFDYPLHLIVEIVDLKEIGTEDSNIFLDLISLFFDLFVLRLPLL